jgi:WhiB family redox-sensing transcriptional regulator
VVHVVGDDEYDWHEPHQATQQQKAEHMTAPTRQDWSLSARCRGTGDAMFPEAVQQKRVRQLCHGCPVRAECLAEALDGRMEWGVWGGLTERERRTLLRARPDVTTWGALLRTEPV